MSATTCPKCGATENQREGDGLCLASAECALRVELARLRAENQRLTAELRGPGGFIECQELTGEILRSALEGSPEADADLPHPRPANRAAAAIVRLTAERDEAQVQLRAVDSALARRPALDDEPDRVDKILKSIRVAAKADAAESALPAVREQCARLADELERTGRRMPNHACRECVPFSEILVDGFQCPYHAAIRAIPIEATQPETCPGPHCLMCSGDACNKCGAGCWDSGVRNCQHDSMERHEKQRAIPIEVKT